jgi:dihydroneopterin aldolase
MNTQVIFIQGLRIPAPIGVHEHEKAAWQTLQIDTDITVADHRFQPQADDLSEVFDYQALRATLISVAQAQHTHLLETLADRMIQAVWAWPDVQSVRLRLSKFTAFADCDSVGIEVFRERRHG